MSIAKLLVIGLDSADKDLMLHWAADGSLPHFARLLESGAYGEIHAAPGETAGSIWPSINTGCSQAVHGYYHDWQLKPGSYEYARIRPSDFKAAPFWETLSLAGKRIAIIDVPKASISDDFNGVQILDWGNHDPGYEQTRSFPESLAQTIESRFGRDPVGSCDKICRHNAGAVGLTALRDRLVKRIGIKVAIIQYVLDQGPWDLAIGAFADLHCAGHQFWHVHDPHHPRFDPDLARRIGNPLKDVYMALDRGMGDLLAKMDPSSRLLVFSDLGMGPNYSGTFLLRDIVRRLYAHAHKRGPTAVEALRWLWRKLPRSARLRGRALISPISRDIDLEVKGRDYFVVRSTDDSGAIRINLHGREPAGHITPGREYDELCDVISQELATIVNLETGEPLIRRVLKIHHLYEGPCQHDLPDLHIVWNRDAPIRKIYSPKIGLIERDPEYHRTGDHRSKGFFLTIGPGIRRGNLPPISSVDLAPDICAGLGVTLEVDGSRLRSRPDA